MIQLFNYLIVSNIFTGGFVFSTFLPFSFQIGYIIIICFLIAYIFYYQNIVINFNFLVILIAVTFFSILNVCLENVSLLFVAKQVIGILITGIAYYLLIKVNNCEIEKLFKIYIKLAVIVAGIGIFQEVSFLIGFKSGYDYSNIIKMWGFTPTEFGMLRVNSIFMEPSHFAISMVPAFFVSIISISRKNYLNLNSQWGSVIIIVSYILTFSVFAYVAIFISILFIFFNVNNFKKLLLPLIILPIFVFITYNIPDIKMRVDDTIGIGTGSIKPSKAHLSSYSIISNAFISYKSFIDNPLFGRGLGSHPMSYDEFIGSGVSIGVGLEDATIVNKDDAGSLFLRLVSETGLFGIIVVLYFLFGFRLKMSDKNELQIINNAIFILFILQLFKQGHYFYNGLFFFIWVYYFAYKISNKPNLFCYHSNSI